MLRRLLPEGVRLEIDCAQELPKVLLDPSQLERVAMNLVVNARDAMPAGGLVRLRTSSAWFDELAVQPYPGLRAGRFVVLSVSDTGQGIPEAARRRIFEPFFTTKSASGGTGLGLSTVHAIAQRAGGYVRVDSVPGNGATFHVCLPALDVAAERPSPALADSDRG